MFGLSAFTKMRERCVEAGFGKVWDPAQKIPQRKNVGLCRKMRECWNERNFFLLFCLKSMHKFNSEKVKQWAGFIGAIGPAFFRDVQHFLYILRIFDQYKFIM